MKEIVIVGTGGHARDICCTALACGRTVRGFLDDGDAEHDVMGRPVLGRVADWVKFPDCQFVVGVGSPAVRRSIVARMEEAGSPDWATLVHPSLITFNPSQIGHGTVVFAGSIFATDVSVGRHCAISLLVTLGHDTVIEDFCTLAPKAAISGNVVCEQAVEVGTMAAVRQGLRLCAGSIAGMGAIVTKNVSAGTTVVGNPARPLVKS